MNKPFKTDKFWDKIAHKYDQFEKSSEPTYLKIIEETKKYLNINDVILDCGCGTGLISSEIAEYVKVVYALDTSSKMIEVAQKKADARKIQNIEYKHTSIFDQSYKQSSIDLILVSYLFHLIDDIEIIMNRINELLKPGGLIISVTPCLGEHKSLLRLILYIFGKIRLFPVVKPLKLTELEKLIINGKFEIVESLCLNQIGPQFFIAAKKL